MNKIALMLITSFFVFQAPAFAETKVKKEDRRFEKLELFNKVLFLIESQYYREVSTEKLIEGALKGMMDTLDPHSDFLDEEIFSKVQEDTKGEFGGIGVEVTQKDGMIVVVAPIEDSPAYQAGIKQGDRIVEINGESVVHLPLIKAVKLMKGKLGTKINMGILRSGSESMIEFSVMRRLIKNNPVKFELLKDKVAYIRLTQFQENSSKYIRKALKVMSKKTKKLTGIILDLRGNPGGLLDEAVNVSSIFLEKGIVVSTEARNKRNREIRYVKKSGVKYLNVPLIVLVNSSSASASEIVAGSLQDHERAVIMGEQSFGKGTVQTVAKVDDKSGVKLTIAQYLTPKGRKIQAIGIMPDIQIDQFSTDWKEKILESNLPVLREKDLRNHLTATFETPQEKKIRLKREIEDRRMRRHSLDKMKDKNSKKSYLDDFQVLQAYRQILSAKIIKSIWKK